ncbi:MAG: hypothetical protein WCI97_02465 [Bacteroidota bacterium]
MKLLITIFTLCLISAFSYAQIPQALTYQAVARNSAGTALVNTNISVRVSIKDLTATGTTLYSETQSATTNQFGLFTLALGTGTVVSGNFSTISWAVGAKFMKVELDPAGGSSYIDMGTSQLLSVPYALVAGSTVNVPSLTLNDLTDVNTAGVTANQVLLWNGTNWVPGTISGGDNWGTQAAVTNSTLSGNGTSATPLGLAQQGASSGQVLKWNGTNWAPGSDNVGSSSGSVNVTARLTGDGTLANPLDIAQQAATSGQVLKWGGSSWVPSTDLDQQALNLIGNTLSLTNGGSVTLPTGTTYTAGTGINLGGNVITNTAPDQIVSLTGTGNTTVTGAYPNFTINSTGGGGSYTAGTGISIAGTVISNAGDLSATNEIQSLSIVGNQLSLSLGGGSVTLPTGTTYTAGTGISLAGNVITNTSLNTDAQILSVAGNQLTISGGNTVTLPTGTTYTAGTGISLAGNVVTNTLPDQTVTLTSGSGINVTGTYPNFTIAATGGGGGISGSGTVNYVPKFTPTGTALGNSQIQDNGTNLGIAAAPDATNKVLIAPGASTTGGLKVNYTNTTNNTYGINVNSTTGNSYIGYTGTITFGTLTGTNPEIYGSSSSGVSAGVFGATSGTNTSAAVVGLSNNWHGGFFASNDLQGGVGLLGSYTGATGSFGVFGIYGGTTDTGVGVLGYNSKATGGINIGVEGTYNTTAYGLGVVGVGYGGGIPVAYNDYGVWGSCSNLLGGFAVYADGDLTCTGAKNASVGTSKGNQLVYSIESPEVWFEDFGTATLVSGQATVTLDPLYLETVFIDANHPMIVTVTPQGDCKGLYVEPGTTSFTIKELNGGTSNINCSYRITCKRLNYQDHKFGSDITWGGGDTRANYHYIQPKPIDYNAMKQISIEGKKNNLGNNSNQKYTSKVSLTAPK